MSASRTTRASRHTTRNMMWPADGPSSFESDLNLGIGQSPQSRVEIEHLQPDITVGAGEGDLAMKAFLLFLLLGGAALYTFLVVTHDALQDGKQKIPSPSKLNLTNLSPSS